MTLRALIVEDEPDIADLLAMYFAKEGWDTQLALDGERGLELARATQPDLVLLDVGLPGDLSGLDVCRQLRESSDVPIMFITAREDEIDRILGFELGADDYVTKPFSPREVLVRARAIVRRTRRSGASTVDFGSVSVDLERQEVTVQDEPVALATQELALITYLVENVGRALSRQQILDGAWGEGWVGDIRTVDVHIRQLRKKLGDDLPLATVRGVGYRLG